MTDPTRRRPRATAAPAMFLLAVVAANATTSHLGLIPVGLGLTVTAGTFAAGFALVARDVLQDAAGRRAVIAAIVAGALISALFADGRIAIASGVAFLLGELVDMAVYTPLRDRGWTRAVVASNAVGGVVDTVLFLAIAGFGLTWGAVGGQWLVKMAVTLATVVIVGGLRAVLREPVHTEGA